MIFESVPCVTGRNRLCEGDQPRKKSAPAGALLDVVPGSGPQIYLQIFATAAARIGTVSAFNPAMFKRESPTM